MLGDRSNIERGGCVQTDTVETRISQVGAALLR